MVFKGHNHITLTKQKDVVVCIDGRMDGGIISIDKTSRLLYRGAKMRMDGWVIY